jgi:hypothetical protein
MPLTSSRSSNFYRRILSQGIDSPIAGLTANNSTKLIFSTQTPNGGVSPVYVRSTTCWAKNIDLSPLSPWNSNGGTQQAGTLISPRHIVFANHFIIPNSSTLIFVDMNNNSYTRTLSNSLQVGSTDITIGVLNSDLPSNVSFCKVASFDLASITDSNNKVAALYTDQEEKALVGDFYNSNSSANLSSPVNSQRANFYEFPIIGDSGDPIGFVYNNKLILLFTFTGPTTGPSIPYYINEINSVMTTLGGGYTLSIFNKEDIVSQEKNISIKKQSAGSGKINLRPRVYAFIATNTGIGTSPNINNLRFYDTGLTQNGQIIYYDETKVYWLTYVTGFWIIAPIGTTGASGLFVKFSGINPVGSYSGVTGYLGTATISAI